MISDAKWVTGGGVFLKNFHVSGGLASASLAITAQGLYEAFVNGEKAGDFILAPGFTDYKKRRPYQRYDITNSLKSGFNEILVYLGNGWEINWFRFNDRKALIAEITLFYADRIEYVRTDESWLWGESPVVSDSVYDGETHDARVKLSCCTAARIPDAPADNLYPMDGVFVKEHERLSPVSFFVTPKGEKVIDFGQNLAGYVEFTVDAKSGDVVRLSHAEVLDKDGNFYTENLQSAKALVTYICKDGVQTYKPRFTFMGYRYVRLDEFPGEPRFETIKNDFKSIAVYSDMKRTGFFECSVPMINKLYENILWGQKSNFIDIPTDCPQRDERLGWTADAQVFMKAAGYNFNVEKFFAKWLADMRAEQLSDGNIPNFVPGRVYSSSAVWGDAAVICPWRLYVTYGDKDLLAANYEMMQKWTAFTGRVENRRHFGDWLGLDAVPGSRKGKWDEKYDHKKGATDDEFIREVFRANSVGICVKAGRALGYDVSGYEKLYAEIVSGFKKEFECKTQTEHVLALYFKLTDEPAKVAKSLADMIVSNGTRLQTGFTGTPYLLHALSENGYAKLAYDLLLQTECPSWLYPITKGATTVWEHWDGIKPDGSFWDPQMNSFNHYAYGAVADWLYEAAAGIKIDESKPAFENVIIKPFPDARFKRLRVCVETKRGAVSSEWKIREDGTVEYEIRVPNTATICIGGETRDVGEGTYRFESGIGAELTNMPIFFHHD